MNKLRIVYAPTALIELDEIWNWNAENYGIAHADVYIGFLLDEIDDLATNIHRGRTVESRSDLRFIVIQRKPRRHGHIAVYAVDELNGSVNIAHIFHTSQNWPDKL